MRMRHFAISEPAPLYSIFSTLCHKRYDFRKKENHINSKCVPHRHNIQFYFTLSIVYVNLKETAFRKTVLLPSSGNKAHNLVEPSDEAILSHWYLRTARSEGLCASLPEEGSRTGFRIVLSFKML
jgi:hypothetical protein